MFGVAANRPAQILLAGGCLTAGVLCVDSLVKAFSEGAPYIIAIFGLFIFAFVSVTRRSVPVAARAIAAGGIIGVTTALVPAVAIMLWPPVPQSSDWAVVVVATAMVAAAVCTPPHGDPRFVNPVLSGVLAGVIAALLIEPAVAAMAQFGPESWVPQMTSHALTPAARLSERRHLAGEPYLLVLLLGDVLSLILGILALTVRRWAGTTRPMQPVDGPRQIELGEA